MLSPCHLFQLQFPENGSFAIALARACHEQGLNVCVDTSGYAPGDAFREMAQWADTFLFDIKETDPILHRQYTGVDMQLIHDNLRLLDGLGKQLRLRCPIIPGLNDREEHLRGIAALAESLQQTHPIDVIPYHPLGEKKLDWLDEVHTMQVQSFPEKEEVDGWIACIAAHTRCPVQHA